MRWSDLPKVSCSVARAVSVVGDRWTLLVLRDLFLGVRRFEDFERRLGIARPVLSQRLKKLVEEDVLNRVRYEERPARYEYRLTSKGRDLYPVVMSLTAWGDKYMSGPDGAPVVTRHVPCGNFITPQLTCPDCGEPVLAKDMEAMPGPGATEAAHQPASPRKADR
ncbi:helix-turn-helix domain-containing protein [Pyruvatibacter sp.]|uniref:winged helix-turn-helix transcriptional regulator n=1 Tax=Pyruvatibacter sp. TaxID=1981328 RepID=UPI0032EE40B4